MAAGSNPRQKMINLMYLVLIAMLALNVDTKVLKKFLLINQSFEATNSEKVSDNTRKIESIKAAVEDSGNRKEDLEVLKLCAVCISETSGGQLALFVIVLSFVILGLLNTSWKKNFQKKQKSSS